MSTATTERTDYSLDRAPSYGSVSGEPKVVEVIDNSLHFVDTLRDDEVDRRFASLVTCAQRLKLPQYVGEGQIDEYLRVIPNSGELLERIHDTAEEVLADDVFDEDASLTVNYLGIAADVTRDKTLIEKTLHAIHDTHDFSLDMSRRALKIALDQDRLYYEVYRELKNGKLVSRQAVEMYNPVPMSQRPDFDRDDELAKWLSVREVELPRHYTYEEVIEALDFKTTHKHQR